MCSCNEFYTFLFLRVIRAITNFPKWWIAMPQGNCDWFHYAWMPMARLNVFRTRPGALLQQLLHSNSYYSNLNTLLSTIQGNPSRLKCFCLVPTFSLFQKWLCHHAQVGYFPTVKHYPPAKSRTQDLVRRLYVGTKLEASIKKTRILLARNGSWDRVLWSWSKSHF